MRGQRRARADLVAPADSSARRSRDRRLGHFGRESRRRDAQGQSAGRESAGAAGAAHESDEAEKEHLLSGLHSGQSGKFTYNNRWIMAGNRYVDSFFPSCM